MSCVRAGPRWQSALRQSLESTLIIFLSVSGLHKGQEHRPFDDVTRSRNTKRAWARMPGSLTVGQSRTSALIDRHYASRAAVNVSRSDYARAPVAVPFVARNSSKAQCRLPRKQSGKGLQLSMSVRTEKFELYARAATNLPAWQIILTRQVPTQCAPTETQWSGSRLG